MQCCSSLPHDVGAAACPAPLDRSSPITFLANLALLPHPRRGADAGGQAAQRCVAQCVAVLVVQRGPDQVQATVKELLAMLKAHDTGVGCCIVVTRFNM